MKTIYLSAIILLMSLQSMAQKYVGLHIQEIRIWTNNYVDSFQHDLNNVIRILPVVEYYTQFKKHNIKIGIGHSIIKQKSNRFSNYIGQDIYYDTLKNKFKQAYLSIATWKEYAQKKNKFVVQLEGASDYVYQNNYVDKSYYRNRTSDTLDIYHESSNSWPNQLG
jgi:hypothetical protein